MFFKQHEMRVRRQKYRKLLAAALAGLALLCNCLAQGPHAYVAWDPSDAQTPLFNGPVHKLTVDDGLPDLHVTDFLEDSQGFIWIVSNTGIVRCDGRMLEEVTFPVSGDAFHTCLAEDTATHTIWIGGGQGLFRINSLTGETSECFNTQGHPVDKIHTIAVDRNHRVWIGRETGYATVDPAGDVAQEHTVKGFGSQIPNIRANCVLSLMPDPIDHDIVWFGTRYGIIRIDAKSDTAVHMGMQLSGFPEHFSVVSIVHDRVNAEFIIGAASTTNTYVPFHFLRFDYTSRQYREGLRIHPDWISRDAFHADDGALWLTTGDGVARYNTTLQQVDTIIPYDPDAVFPGRIDFIDSHGMVWTSTAAGIAVFKPAQTNVESYYYIPDNPRGYHVCTDLTHRSGKVFMSVFGGRGVYAFDTRTKEWSLMQPDIPEEDFFSGTAVGFDSRGQMVVTSNRGFYKEVSGHLQKFPTPLDKMPHQSWREAAVDPDGRLWAIAVNVLYRYNPATGEVDDFSEELRDCVESQPVRRINIDSRSNFWFYGTCPGWSVYRKDKREFIHNRYLDNSDGEEILGQVISVCSDVGHAYVVNMDLEIGRIDLDNLAAGSEMYFNLHEVYRQQQNRDSVDHALLGAARSAALDGRGNLWIITTSHVLRVDLDNPEIIVFDPEDGFVLDDREMKVFVADHLTSMDDGRFVYSTRKGIHIFDPAAVVSARRDLVPYLTAIYVNGQPYQKDTIAPLKTQYSLRPSENNVAFDFSAMRAVSGKAPRFAYRLSPLDERWVESRSGNHIAYANLPAGDYTFSLRVADPSGNWSPLTRHLDIHIDQHWWLTIYAKIGAILLIALLIFGWYRYRMRSILQREKMARDYERKLAEVKMNMLTAQMNPHFIFNSLNSIDYYIIKNDTLKASDYLNRFARLIRLILNHSRSNYITLAEELEALRLYIEIENLRFGNKFDYIVRAGSDVDLDAIQIPPMLLQPYVENAIWHGLMHKETKGCLKVDVQMDDSSNGRGEAIIATVTDNGVGRTRASELKSKRAGKKKSKSMGMHITQDKIQVFNYLHDLNATVEVEDLVDEMQEASGTRVTLRIPV